MMTKKQATKRGKELVRKMKGKGWKLRVWENIGWHFSADNPPLSVYSDEDGLAWCLMTDREEFSGAGSMIWHLDKNYSKNPNLVVERQVAEARKQVDMILATVERAEKIIGDKKGGEGK